MGASGLFRVLVDMGGLPFIAADDVGMGLTVLNVAIQMEPGAPDAQATGIGDRESAAGVRRTTVCWG